MTVCSSGHNPQIPTRAKLPYEKEPDLFSRTCALHRSRAGSRMHPTCNATGHTDSNTSAHYSYGNANSIINTHFSDTRANPDPA